MSLITSNIPVTGTLTPYYTEDTYAVTTETYHKGGFRTVANTTARDAIPTDRLKEGMIVAVESDWKVYQLQSGSWVEWNPSSIVTDPNAVHYNIADEFDSQSTIKSSVADNDRFLIEDSTNSYDKKYTNATTMKNYMLSGITQGQWGLTTTPTGWNRLYPLNWVTNGRLDMAQTTSAVDGYNDTLLYVHGIPDSGNNIGVDASEKDALGIKFHTGDGAGSEYMKFQGTTHPSAGSAVQYDMITLKQDTAYHVTDIHYFGYNVKWDVDSSGWSRKTNGTAGLFEMSDDNFQWYRAISDSEGATPIWIDNFRFFLGDGLGSGTTPHFNLGSFDPITLPEANTNIRGASYSQIRFPSDYNIQLLSNAYFDGTWKYGNGPNIPASLIQLNSGNIEFLSGIGGDPGSSLSLTLDGKISSDGLVLKSGATVNEFSTDGTLAGDSDTAVPTEKAVKTYVDGKLQTFSKTISFEKPVAGDQFTMWYLRDDITITEIRAVCVKDTGTPDVDLTIRSATERDYSGVLNATYNGLSNTVAGQTLPLTVANLDAGGWIWVDIDEATNSPKSVTVDVKYILR